MQTTGAHSQNMPRDECLRLMATTSVGRIVYTQRAMPAVEVVAFTLDGGDIVIRAMCDPLAMAIRGTVVAFEADHVDPDNRIGWAVTVIGLARQVDDPSPIGCSASSGGREHEIRIRPEIVTGLHLTVAVTPPECRLRPDRYQGPAMHGTFASEPGAQLRVG
jgi:hypothetical protein